MTPPKIDFEKFFGRRNASSFGERITHGLFFREQISP
jgi:hypothetical protein